MAKAPPEWDKGKEDSDNPEEAQWWKDNPKAPKEDEKHAGPCPVPCPWMALWHTVMGLVREDLRKLRAKAIGVQARGESLDRPTLAVATYIERILDVAYPQHRGKHGLDY